MRKSHSYDESKSMTNCPYCFRDLHQQESFLHYLYRDSCLCGVCRKQLVVVNKKAVIDGLPITMFYQYNDFFESMIFQFKEGRDIALRQVFFHECIKQLNDRYRHFTIILMPSSKEKMMERRFLPVKEMLCECKLPILEPFYKVNNHKQSLQSMETRKMIAQVIKRNPTIKIPPKPLLLVDDVCTSGSTILCAYQKLLPHRFKIEAFVLSAHPLFVESCDEKGLLKKTGFSIL